ncbi:basic secretory family protein [Massilia sp. TS11]|uniref:basic secretory family protein n=1 Tax=Massilia sp. TS11 TaxID=2908003 RepID=UPI001EDA0496|nr:basic secretory family protein [Massilia sp. TS11]MCG2586104.1 basic secretory family protein [Massilia sp. TS11]
MPRIAAVKAALLLTLAGPASAVVSVDTDLSRAPQAKALASRAQQLVAEWGPRVNTLLYGPRRGATLERVRIVFEPAAREDGALSYVREGVIHLTAGTAPAQAETLLIHDLTHLYQHDLPEGKWLLEGIADYVSHVQFAKDLGPRLRLDADGHLSGYSASQPFFYWLQENRVDLRQRGYLAGNEVTASFLHWIVLNKDKDIIRRLASAIRDDKYSEAVWAEASGESLDRLWQQFIQ